MLGSSPIGTWLLWGGTLTPLASENIFYSIYSHLYVILFDLIFVVVEILSELYKLSHEYWKNGFFIFSNFLIFDSSAILLFANLSVFFWTHLTFGSDLRQEHLQ